MYSHALEDDVIIAFSHLRWDFVYQRPQHLLSRLANQRRVIVVEEPVRDKSAEPFFERIKPERNVLVLRPHTPLESAGFSDEQIALLKTMLAGVDELKNTGGNILWFYTPMALPLAEDLTPRAIIYDCMDELSAFLHAPRELVRREAELLHLADLVFTGGPSLYRHKKNRNPNVHCFPSSVDAQHFARAAEGDAEHHDQIGLPRPRLGFFGVIDERLDVGLLQALADSHREWQIAMVGPVVKIDPRTLPQAPNLHYFGQRRYEELPLFLSGWDVGLLLFARNQSTRFISPTKTLEYLAAQRPVVSTPINDVVELYGEAVRIAETPAQFIAACEHALAETPRERAQREAKAKRILARTSWDAVAAAMESLIGTVLARRRQEPAGRSRTAAPVVATAPLPGPRPSSVLTGLAKGALPKATPPVVVVGAGPTGLSAAYHLGGDSLLLERNGTVGGWCRSMEDSGFTFDFAGHIMFSNEPYVHEMYKLLLGDNVHWQNREAWIYSKGVYTRYPFQGAL
jgi:UDP-galactopyranose mutase